MIVGESMALGDLNLTRTSCLECVEKHLGAAWVLLGEVRNGYPYRLLAVGHLHEAEDESQTFPELNRTIRESRKAFQTKGILPDWARLAGLLKQAGAAS